MRSRANQDFRDPEMTSALASTHAALAAEARASAFMMVKDRARAYRRTPRELDALFPGLRELHPGMQFLALRSLLPTAQRWFGFGGEVPAINLRAAMVYARWLRRYHVNVQEATR
jgi:hypothetical protein